MRKRLSQVWELLSALVPFLLVVAVLVATVGFGLVAMLWSWYIVYTGLMASPPEWGKAVLGMCVLVWAVGPFFEALLKGYSHDKDANRNN